MGISFSHLLLTLCIILIVFGAGKLPRVMGDLGKGIRQFKQQLGAEEETEAKPALAAMESTQSEKPTRE